MDEGSEKIVKDCWKKGFSLAVYFIGTILVILLWHQESLTGGKISQLSPSGRNGVKEIKAFRIASKIRIDGFLDEPAWREGERVTSFLQSKPNYGAQPSESTEVRILYDSENLYVGVKCFDSQPEGVEANMTQRDSELWNDDIFEIFVDSFHDHRSCTYFVTNPLGTQTDGRCTGNGATIESVWDGDWRVKTRTTPWGWCAEFAIPFFNLQFDAKKNQVWGINLMRVHKRTGQDHLWQLEKHFFRISDYGHLGGLSDLKSGRVLEVIPFTTLRRGQNPDYRLKGELGIDLKYSPTSTFSSNLTINPDFAQIEADPDQINLSTEEIRLPEKRPFFLEGCELFGTPTSLFYSRRIGEIKAGGKLTGKANRFSLAIVDVQTGEGRENPIYFQDREANFLAARLKGDIFGSSFVGLTGVNWANQKGYSRAAGVDAGFTIPLDFTLGTQVSLSMDRDKIQGLGKRKGWEKRIDLGHNSQHFEGHLSYLDRDGDFNLGTGYFGGRNNIRGLDGHFTYMRPMKSLRLHDANFNFFFESYDLKDSGKLNYEHFRHNISIFYKLLGYWFANGFDLQWSNENVGGHIYDNRQAYISFIYNFASFENAGLRIKRGESFGAGTKVLEAWLRFKLLGFLSIDLFTNRVTFTGHTNQIGWPDQWVSNLKTRLDLTPNIYLRSFSQANDAYGRDLLRDLNLLLAWEFKRRNILYIAFNHDEEWDDENGRRRATQRILTKVNLFLGI